MYRISFWGFIKFRSSNPGDGSTIKDVTLFTGGEIIVNYNKPM
jgi:hypothetical protein